jgi:hypothetical protein
VIGSEVVVLDHIFSRHQCCESGIRCFFDPLVPEWKKIQIQDKLPEIIFLSIWNQFFGLKIVKFFDGDPGYFKPWIRDGKNRIRNTEMDLSIMTTISRPLRLPSF